MVDSEDGCKSCQCNNVSWNPTSFVVEEEWWWMKMEGRSKMEVCCC